MNARGIALAGATAAIALAAAACGTTTAPGTSEQTVNSTVTQPVTAINLTNDAGSVTVHTGGSTVVINRRVTYVSGGKPSPGQQLQGGTLTLTGCSTCGIAYDLTVPVSITLTIVNRAGAVLVDGAAGDLDLTTDAGALTGTGLSSATVTARSSAGAITLGFTKQPKNVTAKAQAGSVTLTVPGGPYKVDASSTAGQQAVSVPTSPSAKSKLTVSSQTGSVTVTKG